MHVFYTPDISSDEYILSEEESKHCTRVLRLGVGDTIHLIDGRGGFYKAEIQSEAKRRVYVKVFETTIEHRKRNHALHIAVAPTKNIERLEWFLEKATEIGIDEITPIICEHSERKIIKQDRLNKVITSAVKQSQQAYHPVLNPQILLTDFLKKASESVKMIAHCIADEPKKYISEIASPNQDCLILIGPEGDFSNQEISAALESGFKPLTLGNTRLRTETAALAACFEVNYLNR